VGEWYYSHLAGIRHDQSEPGFKRSVIKPLLTEGLEWARASLETVYGLLSSSWDITDGQFTMNISIPPNTRSEIHFPVSYVRKIMESGMVVYDNKEIVANPEEFKLINSSEDEIIIEVGAGDYYFEVE
jgi:alpha-L-rhamnosidase